MIAENEALLIIDMQKGFDDPYWGRRNNPRAEFNGLRLLQQWRALGGRVIFAVHGSTNQHSPLHPEASGYCYKFGFEPRETDWLIKKSVNSAFIGTDLSFRLEAAGIENLCIFGITTDQCVSTTVRMASNLGYHTTLIEDACACFEQTAKDGSILEADLIHKVHVTTLMTEFAKVVTTEEWLTNFPTLEGHASK